MSKKKEPGLIPDKVPMIRDPFQMPPASVTYGKDTSESQVASKSLLQMSMPKSSIPKEMLEAVAKAGLTETLKDKAFLLSNRASDPKFVIDAKPSGTCVRCGEVVWISPSSERALAEESMPIVCTVCVPAELALGLTR